MVRVAPTIRDVALQAGVSVSTASKAFNNKAQVAAETRRRVLEAAETLHFAPNALVRSLQRGHTNTVGVCTWQVKSPSIQDITMSLLTGIAVGVATTGRDLLLYADTPLKTGTLKAAIFLDGRADGLILGPCSLSAEELAFLAGAGLPTVVVYRRDVPAGMGAVTISNTSGIGAALDYLVGLGHRRIAFCAPQLSPDMAERREGYTSGLARTGISFDPDLCLLPLSWDFDINLACATLLGRQSPPTAMIAGDDALAFRWIVALKEHGLKVPEDFSVIGFDDSPAACAAPGLTTIRQSAEEVGHLAAAFISCLIEGGRAGDCRAELPVELIVRGSAQPPRT